jgi:ubiquinone/menaquinone biosynthesis C-methylase UbiE
MPDAREIYELHAEQYDELVRCEDRGGNLLPAIQAIAPLAGVDVVELGAGSGRVTTLLAPHVRSIRAFDASAPMLEVARQHLTQLGTTNWELAVADNTSLPVESGSAQLAIAGWTFGHQTVWHETEWRQPIERALREMLRVLAPGGTAIAIETLGTGHVTPFDPPAPLARYYALLEEEFQFARTWIRTDYEFPSSADAERLVRFFFGEAAGCAIADSGQRRLPECTGLWYLTVRANGALTLTRG